MSALQPPAPYLGKGNSYDKQPFVPWVHRYSVVHAHRPITLPTGEAGHTLARCERGHPRRLASAFAEVRPGVFCWLCAACADELERGPA